MRDPRAILITGASSGIGEALAKAYAGPGIALALTGRDGVRLEASASACRSRGATVLAETVDAADRVAMERVPAVYTNRILLRDGLPIAALEAGQMTVLERQSGEPEHLIERALRIGSMPAPLRPYYA